MNASNDPEPSRRFYQGTIVELRPGSRQGVIRSDHGRDFPFLARDVRLVGSVERFIDLREGWRVGFDLGRTSRGLDVTVIHVAPGPVDQSGSDVR